MPSNHRLQLSTEAADDIISIVQYTLQEWGPAQAEIYEAILKDAIESLTQFPFMGSLHPDAPGDVRALFVGQHIVYYYVVNETVWVLRVVHQRIDIAELFESLFDD